MNILDKICQLKHEEIVLLKKKFKPLEQKIQTRGFLKRLLVKDDNNFNLIAEIKKSSPSKGLICKNFDPIKIAIDYEKAGAKCLSVLTEKNYFGGNINYISQIKKFVNIPILRKDFIIDEWQIIESYHAGADCILLIFAILNNLQIKKFYNLSNKLGMDVICEVHDENELSRAIKLQVNCIGINNRNLKTLGIDKNTFHLLSNKIPNKTIKICESGLTCNEDLKKFTISGADAFLIGETLMKSKNIYEETKKIIKK
ncbi:MAG: indole-3-glycerol phosphate synthase [Rickettsiales bacterium]|nr:indole-3-glycerol phosphate synthase [Rickettsiales bacterium]|tara:strand:- start:1337 stop:2104 length:768 start_codon:yes stop_codon:yes gene_type:complete